jgi:pyruvate ferredoxin oxidoreductase alpha subunit
MTIDAPVKYGGHASPEAALADRRDAAIACAVRGCRAVVLRSLARGGDDVIAAAIDACSSGETVYISTDGEGLLRMAPALFRASHLGLPIVMTVGDAAGRRDHGQAMALRDCGWIQLYPSDDQDAVDTHIQAVRIAESLNVPVMVCMGTFAAGASLRVPSDDAIDAFLTREPSPRRGPPVRPGEPLDKHMEMRYLAHVKQTVALKAIRQVAADFRARFGRRSGGSMTTHQIYAAKVGVVGLGSTFEAITAAVDELRAHGVSIGAVGLRAFRPFPAHDVASALLHCQRVVIVERAIAVGLGGIVSTEVRATLSRLPVQSHTVIAGLGDRTISPRALQRSLYRAAHGNLEELSFLDLNRDVIRSHGSLKLS